MVLSPAQCFQSASLHLMHSTLPGCVKSPWIMQQSQSKCRHATVNVNIISGICMQTSLQAGSSRQSQHLRAWKLLQSRKLMSCKPAWKCGCDLLCGCCFVLRR